MSDSDRSLEILITTKADLAGAKDAEAQLDQDAAKAKELGAAYDELGGKLTNSPDDADAGDGNETLLRDGGGLKARDTGIPGLSGQEHERDAIVRGAPDKSGLDTISPANGEAVLSGLQAGIEGLRLAVERMAAFFSLATNPNSANDDRTIPREESFQSLNDRSDRPNAQGGAVGTERQESGSFSGRAENDTPEIFGKGEVIQSSGEKMRVALEQNARVTALMFNRMLDLIEAQNRRLGDVDRRITEISGQIKSLKNL
jgi:hypothetical protein